MKCVDIQLLLLREEEVREGEVALVEEHLRSCASCRTWNETQDFTPELLEALGPDYVALPFEEFTKRLHERVPWLREIARR